MIIILKNWKEGMKTGFDSEMGTKVFDVVVLLSSNCWTFEPNGVEVGSVETFWEVL